MSAFYCLQALSIVLLIPPFVLQISLKVEQSACQSNLQSYSNLIVVSLGLTSLIVSLAAIIYLNVK